MKYLGAYLLANLGGNASPSAQDILNILGAGGVDCDMENANTVVGALNGKNISEVIAEGKKKMATVPSGGAPAAAPAGAAAAAAPAAKAAEKKVEEEESDEEIGFGLFDD